MKDLNIISNLKKGLEKLDKNKIDDLIDKQKVINAILFNNECRYSLYDVIILIIATINNNILN